MPRIATLSTHVSCWHIRLYVIVHSNMPRVPNRAGAMPLSIIIASPIRNPRRWNTSTRISHAALQCSMSSYIFSLTSEPKAAVAPCALQISVSIWSIRRSRYLTFHLRVYNCIFCSAVNMYRLRQQFTNRFTFQQNSRFSTNSSSSPRPPSHTPECALSTRCSIILHLPCMLRERERRSTAARHR